MIRIAGLALFAVVLAAPAHSQGDNFDRQVTCTRLAQEFVSDPRSGIDRGATYEAKYNSSLKQCFVSTSQLLTSRDDPNWLRKPHEMTRTIYDAATRRAVASSTFAYKSAFEFSHSLYCHSDLKGQCSTKAEWEAIEAYYMQTPSQ